MKYLASIEKLFNIAYYSPYTHVFAYWREQDTPGRENELHHLPAPPATEERAAPSTVSDQLLFITSAIFSMHSPFCSKASWQVVLTELHDES